MSSLSSVQYLDLRLIKFKGKELLTLDDEACEDYRPNLLSSINTDFSKLRPSLKCRTYQ